MKKLFLLAASALVVLSCNTKSTSPNGEETTAKRELKTQVFSYEKSDNRANVKLSIEMPVGGDEELGEIIYDFILEKLTDDHDCSDDLSVYRNDGQGLVDLFIDRAGQDLHIRRLVLCKTSERLVIKRSYGNSVWCW